MTKMITVTGRSGAGKTTVAAILAEKLAEKHVVCLIDNNRNNINIYSTVSSVDNINLYACLVDKESCCQAIKESATELKRNLYFFSGGHELLAEEEIQILKEHGIFEYIILDSIAEISDELSDFNISVVNTNVFEYKTATEKLITAEKISKCLIIINRYTENTEFKVNKQDFKLYFCPEITDFANGFELILPEESKKEIERIIEKITGDKSEVKNKKKFNLFGRR